MIQASRKGCRSLAFRSGESDARGESGPVEAAWIVEPVAPQDGGARYYKYSKPLETHPALFLEFADLTIDEELKSIDIDRILEFASEHGRLGLSPCPSNELALDDSEQLSLDGPEEEWAKWPALYHRIEIQHEGDSLEGEALAAWADEIRLMRLAVQTLDALNQRNRKAYRDTGWGTLPALSRFEHWWSENWRIADGGRPDSPFLEHLIESRGIAEGQPFHLHDDDYPSSLGEAFELILQSLVNSKLATNSSPGIRVQRESKRRLGILPHNLLGAMWLQLAINTTGATNHRQCEACSKWIALYADPSHPNARRSDTRYCNQACSQAGYRRRQAVLRKRARGESWAALAREYKVKVKTVRQWHKEALEGAGKKRLRE